MTNPLHTLRKLLLRAYPLFQGCAPCPHRPLPLKKRACSPREFLFPVDLVYTWVNGYDPALTAKRNRYAPPEDQRDPLAQGHALYADNQELRFSLRSIEKYAPWIRRIFIVTDGQAPAWLNLAHEKIRLVDHTDCIPAKYLPTFNSHVIEAFVHTIPGLAEHYLYSNDDFFLSAPCLPGNFFTPNGLPFLFLDWRKSRREGYYRPERPHACSYFNARAFLAARGIHLDQEIISAHAPYPQSKKNAEAAFAFFAEAIELFAHNKFRTTQDMAFYCHPLPLWCYAQKRCVPVDTPFYYINTARFDRMAHYTAMLREKDQDVLPLFYCLNDVGELQETHSRHADMQIFLAAFYPEPSSFERTL